MSSTVLGKRTRSSARAAIRGKCCGHSCRLCSGDAKLTRADVASSTSTRATRRTAFVILDEAEQENPFITPKKQNANVKEGSDVEMVEDTEEKEPCTKRGKKAHAKTIASRLPLSVAKENSPAKVCARVVDRTTCTPSTPRHRDALSNKVAVTPSRRLIIAGRPLTPRTPHTSGTPRSTAPTVYNEARQAFARGSAPTVLFGRDAERAELQNFISTRAKAKKSGCIYVSGPPGTGKSAFVSDVCRTVAANATVKTGYINCMSVKNAVDLYRTLLEEFVDITEITEGDEMEELRKLFMQRKTSYAVTLDEVDHLLELDIDLLY